MSNNIPNNKVISASGFGATLSMLAIDILGNRLGIDVSMAEQAAIVFFATFFAGYMIPDRKPVPTLTEVVPNEPG